MVPTTKELLDPFGEYNLMLCKSVVTSFALGYPAPLLTNFNITPPDNPFAWKGGTHLAKIDGVHQYLQQLGTEYDDDLVLMYDATDTWLQLPPEILIQRYFDLVEQSEARLKEQYGKAATKAGFSTRVVFAVQKGCGLTNDQARAPGCLAAPESSLPDDIFGPMTEKISPFEREHVYKRPRWLNSGFVMGAVKDMRKVFQRAYTMSHNGYSNIGSDQYVMTEMLGQQEVWRRLQAEKYATWYEPARSWSLASVPSSGGTPQIPDGRLPSDVGMDTSGINDWHDLYDLTSDFNYELGIALDDRSSLSQVGWSFEKELEFIRHDDDTVIVKLAEERFINSTADSTAALGLPRDLQNISAPLSHLAGTPTAFARSWESIPLVTNLYTGQIPAMVHMCGLEWKARIWTHWAKTWYFPYLRALLDASALGGGVQATTAESVDGHGGLAPIAVTTDKITGRPQQWYARSMAGGVVATDRNLEDGPRYATLESICEKQWDVLLGDGQGKWENPALPL